MRLTSDGDKSRFAVQSTHMKKLIAFVLILMVVLNLVVLLSRSEAKAGDEGCTALKLLDIKLSEIKPGILPGLIKF